MSWIDCIADPDYEIFTEEPYEVRKKSNRKVIKESIDSTGYVILHLNKRKYYKHRILAQQFIENPNNLPCVDHINRNRQDNRLNNLRFVSYSENSKNKTSQGNVIYEYFDEIDEDSMEVEFYGNHVVENYYFHDNIFYFFNGINFRKLYINIDKCGLYFVYMRDVEGNRFRCFYSKFKKEHDLL